MCHTRLLSYETVQTKQYPINMIIFTILYLLPCLQYKRLDHQNKSKTRHEKLELHLYNPNTQLREAKSNSLITFQFS